MNVLEVGKNYVTEFGFNVIPIHDKATSIRWTKWQSKQMLPADFKKLTEKNINYTGIAAVHGINNLRCIDIDKVGNTFDIKECLEALELPSDYDWVVKSGSGRGYHIWFYCEAYVINLNSKAVYVYKPRKADDFNQIEIRWKNSYTVLPPSIHNSGNQYEFVHNEPEEQPHVLNPDTLYNFVDQFCVVPSVSEPKINSNDCNVISETLGFEQHESLLKAINFLSKKRIKRVDWIRGGYSLLSIGTEGKELFKLFSQNPHFPEDDLDKIKKTADSLERSYRPNVTSINQFFNLAYEYGFPKDSPRTKNQDKVFIEFPLCFLSKIESVNDLTKIVSWYVYHLASIGSGSVQPLDSEILEKARQLQVIIPSTHLVKEIYDEFEPFRQLIEAQFGNDAICTVGKQWIFEIIEGQYSLDHFRVFCAIQSSIGKSDPFQWVSIPIILNRIHGAKSPKLFNKLWGDQNPLLTVHQIHRIVRELTKYRFVSRVTFGKRTVYSTRLSEKEMISLFSKKKEESSSKSGKIKYISKRAA